METNRKRALVIKDSPLARDPRVLREVTWLTAAGFEVDTLGRQLEDAMAELEQFQGELDVVRNQLAENDGRVREMETRRDDASQRASAARAGKSFQPASLIASSMLPAKLPLSITPPAGNL